jgi:23S rRNA (adenine1618-N6)-methyltransferase
MIYEMLNTYAMFWFTTLVSKQSHLSSIYKTLNKVNVVEIKTIDMAQGQKPHNRVDLLSEAQQNNGSLNR